MLVVLFVPFLRVWWWVFFPLVLTIELRILYLWWIHWDFAYGKAKWVILEVIPPKEVLVPVKAMEDIFTIMWSTLFDNPSWRERWCEGTLPDAPGWMSWEIASIEGELHFYLRVMASHREVLETALYGHYPELEIHEVSDYTQNVPQNLPNEEWNTYGEDFILGEPAPYPIRTYEKFFEPQGEKISAEEKRIDPISSLLELMSKLGPGEQFWFQMVTMTADDSEFKKESEALIAKITKRPEKKKKSSVGGDTINSIFGVFAFILAGSGKEGEDQEPYGWIDSRKTEEGLDKEMLLTPGEREILTEVENKSKKPVFRVHIRGVYVAKRENWQVGHRILTRAYFNHFQTKNLNYIRFTTSTRPKTQFVFRKSIPLFRSRKMFRKYILRFTPHFPDRKKDCMILSTEELATIYHFPLKITGLVAPTMARVESKKGGPPPNLPTE